VTPQQPDATGAAKTALAIRHLAFEDLGLLHPLLVEHGYDVHYLDAGIDEITLDRVLAADLLVVLGGPIGANDGERYPFIDIEIDAIRARIRDNRRTLGICLGAQLVARALGAAVAPSGDTEIGYAPLDLTPEGLDSPLRHLQHLPVLHWHNDRFDIPHGALRLASTPVCANQAFSADGQVLALQFHLETDPRTIERWLIGHADALATVGIHPQTIRDAAGDAVPDFAARCASVITDWLQPRPRVPAP